MPPDGATWRTALFADWRPEVERGLNVLKSRQALNVRIQGARDDANNKNDINGDHHRNAIHTAMALLQKQPRNRADLTRTSQSGLQKYQKSSRTVIRVVSAVEPREELTEEEKPTK